MKVRVLTLPWDDASGRFDSRELSGFIEPEPPVVPPEVIEVAQHFFVHERRPAWAIMVMYRDGDASPRARSERDFRKDWRADLDEPARRTYDELRLWRTKAAKREGLPPYLICNNRQLAEMASRCPRSLAAYPFRGSRADMGCGGALIGRSWHERSVKFGKGESASGKRVGKRQQPLQRVAG